MDEYDNNETGMECPSCGGTVDVLVEPMSARFFCEEHGCTYSESADGVQSTEDWIDWFQSKYSRNDIAELRRYEG